MLTCKNISKSFKKDFWAKDFHALVDINFQLTDGRIVGFLGANGAGKTTLIKIILGFIKPNSGEVSILGIDSKNAHVKKLVGYMPERPYYYQNLTGNEFLDYCGKLQGLSNAKIVESTKRWASQLEIEFALERQIKGYSKGMLQRLGFVSALLHNPKLIILDEPLSGLDPIGRKEFKDVIKSVNETGVGVFFSSHIVSDVQEVCDDVVVLENGKIIYNGSIKELISQHTNNLYELNYIEDGVEKSMKVEDINKNTEIEHLVNAGCIINKLQKSSVSLEEIVYRLNQ